MAQTSPWYEQYHAVKNSRNWRSWPLIRHVRGAQLRRLIPFGAGRHDHGFPMPRSLACALLVFLTGGTALAQPKPVPDLAAVAKAYDLEIVTRAPEFPVRIAGGSIDGAEATQEDVEKYAAVFAFEWSLYPPDLVKRTRLKRVVFCKDLSFAKQLRTAWQMVRGRQF